MTSSEQPHIVWHLGFQKTGTRTFQEWIVAHKDQLSPHFSMVSKHLNASAIENAGRSLMRPGRFLRNRTLREQRLKYVVRGIRDQTLAHPKKVGLVSSENIIGHWVWHNGLSMFDEAEQVIRLLEQYARPARSSFVFYVRDFDSWLKSAWRQEVMVRRGSLDYEEWREGLPFELDWDVQRDKLAASLSDATSSVQFIELGTDADGGTTGRQILQLCGMAEADIDALPKQERKNIGANSGATDFMLAVNRSDISNKDRRIVRATIEANRKYFVK